VLARGAPLADAELAAPGACSDRRRQLAPSPLHQTPNRNKNVTSHHTQASNWHGYPPCTAWWILSVRQPSRGARTWQVGRGRRDLRGGLRGGRRRGGGGGRGHHGVVSDLLLLGTCRVPEVSFS
jgi:hypothetical protein